MIENITAFILAGGKSSRMGTDKGLMQFEGQPMIAHTIKLLKTIFNRIVIISNNPAYESFNIKVINDDYKNIGPLGGVATGLKDSGTEWNFFIACDMPFMKEEIIELLLKSTNGFEAVIPFHHNQPEPLCALYHKRNFTIFENSINEGDYKMQNVCNKLKYNLVEIPESLFQSSDPFRNLNSISDFPKSR